MSKASDADMAEALEELTGSLGVDLKYPLRENYVAATALFRGLFDVVDYTSAFRHAVSPRQPMKLVEYGKRYPVTVFQTSGLRLNQRNGDILLALVQRALNRGYAPNERILVQVSADELLTAIGKDRRQYNRVWLAVELEHMQSSSFKASATGLLNWNFSLISDIVSDADKKGLKAPTHYEIELNARLTRVFVQCGWSIVKGPVLVQLLEHDQFTRALYLYYCTFPTLPSLHESELQGIFHREGMERKKWLAMLRKGVETLRLLTGWHQFEMLGKATRMGAKLVPRGQVLAVAHSPDAKPTASANATSPSKVATRTSKPRSRRAGDDLNCVWSLGSTVDDLRALGVDAFVASSKGGFSKLRFNLSSIEEVAFEEKLANLGRSTAHKKLEALYAFLLESRASRAEDESDI